MNQPAITIVTPSYNQGAFLEATIDSVLSQNYPQLRYIIIDGNSTDNSQAIIKRHERHLHYWVSQSDGGQADALNRGFAKAPRRGMQLFGYLNSDDLHTRDTLHHVAEAYQESLAKQKGAHGGDDAWLVGNVENFGEGVEPFTTTYPREESDLDRFFWFYANPVHQPGSFWTANLFHRFGPFNTALDYVFDYDFFMRLRFLANIKPLHVPHTLARFRLHEESKTVSQRARFEPEFEKVRAIIAAQLTPPERQRAKRYVSQTKADRLQVAALQMIQYGRRRAALSNLAQSLWYDPSLLFQRRTAGTLKRLLTKSG